MSWSYLPDTGAIDVEYGFWAGDLTPALGTHFHDEGQLTIVLSGSRRFQVGSNALCVRAGHCIYIPPGCPHRSLHHFHEGTGCLNVYSPFPNASQRPVAFELPEFLCRPEAADDRSLSQDVGRWLQADNAEGRSKASSSFLPRIRGSAESIGDIASDCGLSREGFSRKFARDLGMPPHAFRIVSRLNEGRRRLRAGDSIAGTAVELGFADQSHFGRHFRRIYGVTPNAYRESMRQSQTFQTA